MELRIGSSGFSYDFWKGSFYPSDIHADEMLAYYAARFDAVEINNTFYRMPKAQVLKRWNDVVPPQFRFSIKASRRITHEARLEGTADNVSYLFRQLDALGDKLGCVLFQCPGNLRKNLVATALATAAATLRRHGRSFALVGGLPAPEPATKRARQAVAMRELNPVSQTRPRAR